MTSRYEGFTKTYYNQAGQLTSFEETADGGLLIHGVVIMAAGTWTDMHGITTTFSEEVLQRCAGAWDDNAVWTRHAGGAPRSVTEKIGAVINPVYSPSEAAVIGDVVLHRRTDTSKACSELVQMAREQGGIKDVSAETMVIMDGAGNVTDLVFTGLALVEDGACETCRIPAFGKEDKTMADEKENQDPKVDEGGEPGAEDHSEDQTTQTDDDLLELLARFVSNIIPDTKSLIEAVQASEGEDRTRALGRLEGCMSAWGVPVTEEVYSKILDDKLAEFSKTFESKLTDVQNSIAEFSRPAGLKGRAGAEKENPEGKPQTLMTFGRGIPRY